MITEAVMPRAEMSKAIDRGVRCAVCQSLVGQAWGGAYGVNSWVLLCCKDKNHEGITWHDVAEENKRKEYFSMDSKALQTMTETQMVQRVEMARFPQELTPADKRLLAQVAITYGFDPLMGEVSIYQGRPYVSIDGRYRAAQETGKLDGVSSRPATKKEREEWEVPEGDYFFRAEVMVTGANYPFVGWGRVFKAETIGGKGFKPVEKNPQRMAEKRAEAQALRKAFHIPLPSIEDIGAPDDEPTVRVVDVSTGEVTEKLPDPTDTPKPVEKPTEPQSGGKSGDCGIDMDWLRESFKAVKWNDRTCQSWIEATCKVKRAETLEKTIALLDKDQKTKLCDFVAKATGIK